LQVGKGKPPVRISQNHRISQKEKEAKRKKTAAAAAGFAH
jgi:hypothetical protein